MRNLEGDKQMVRIVNTFGDIKTGRQGEVVYQRKYGEQIRRTAQPKRAMASEAQIKHRQLYRDALAWRKQLSLPNRRYLDGYCIANWIVDGYQIPLPWSRFALKLYLEKVRFVIITKPALTETMQESINQAYDDEAELDSHALAYGTTWIAQTFTPSQDLELTKAQIFVRKTGTPGAGKVHLRATDADGHPTGSDLATADIPPGSLPGQFTWMEYSLPYPNLLQGVKYALIVSMEGGSSGNYINWALDSQDPTYAGGNFQHSTNSGTTWTTYDEYDFGFRIYGKWPDIVLTPGLLHVRHPALLKLVHKRGDLTISEYDTLSSLDEEYLTRQVGLDVEAGDTIKATTIAQITYSYTVP